MISSAAQFTFNDFLIRLFPITLCSIFLSLLLMRFLLKKWIETDPKNIDHILEMDENDAIKDPVTLKKTLVIMLLTVILLSLHDIVGLMPATVALISAGIALFINRSDIQVMLERVEWPTLMFFGALFIMVGTLAHTGFLRSVADGIVSVSHGNMIYAALLILWIAAITSAFMDNIPFTVAMLPVISEIVAVTGKEANILWWALAIGVGYGGLATPIGSTPGVVSSGLCERKGEPIRFLDWMKLGVPIMLISISFVSLLIILLPWMMD
jgi:Na+/H+ antiporter NhaD/arsenite permease-like protein